MGYTHYWRRKLILPKRMWDKYIKDLLKAYSNLPKHSESSGGYYKRYLLKIKGWDGTGEPKFTEDAVSFNGEERKRENLSHETFLLFRDFTDYIKNLTYWEWAEKNAKSKDEKEIRRLALKRYRKSLIRKCDLPYFNSCKTARKPYDLFVQISLILAEVNFNRDGKIRFRYSSDGDEEDWEQAWQFVFKNFPEYHSDLMKILLTHKKNGEEDGH